MDEADKDYNVKDIKGRDLSGRANRSISYAHNPEQSLPNGNLKVINAIKEEDEASDEEDLARELKRSRRI